VALSTLSTANLAYRSGIDYGSTNSSRDAFDTCIDERARNANVKTTDEFSTIAAGRHKKKAGRT
jgi:hypothetical protein